MHLPIVLKVIGIKRYPFLSTSPDVFAFGHTRHKIARAAVAHRLEHLFVALDAVHINLSLYGLLGLGVHNLAAGILHVLYGAIVAVLQLNLVDVPSASVLFLSVGG